MVWYGIRRYRGNCIFLYTGDEEDIVKNIILFMNNEKVYRNMANMAKIKRYDTFSHKNIARQAIDIL